MFSKYIDCHTHLHSEESNAGQQVNSGLEILETFWITCREIILREKRENYYNWKTRHKGHILNSIVIDLKTHLTSHPLFQNIEIDYKATPSNHK